MPAPALGSAASYTLASWLFLRLLALIYFAAFISLALQIRGLVGKRGILPAADFLDSRRSAGFRHFWRFPTLCWFSSSDRFMLALCWLGILLSVNLAIGLAAGPTLLLLWLAYLSLFTICRVFLAYQWDILLLETGFLAIFLAPFDFTLRCLPSAASAPYPIVLYLFWWLLFRLMFSSGFVKLRSRDPNWNRLTALAYHYETQPLPTPLAWHARQLPMSFHRACAAVLFGVELVVPWLIFSSPPWQCLAAASFVFLMAVIQLTGNYCFFNLLAIALSLLLLDDQILLVVFRRLFSDQAPAPASEPISSAMAWIHGGLAAMILLLSALPVARLFRLAPHWPRPLLKWFEFFESFHLVNSYGLFSVMTTERPEILIEGSRDGVLWLPYEFKWKPGNPKRAPKFVAPHQPRLDWQLWFAALGFAGANPWFFRLLQRLLEGSPAVLSLLKENPFEAAPPRYIRAVLYRYRFASRQAHRQEGVWWTRERRGVYHPVTELETDTEH